jgi:ferredoxin
MAICPTEALTQIKDKDGAVIYRCDAAACDSCGLCFDVCDSNAIEITEMKPAPADIVLDCWRCPACGVDVHEPSLRNNAGNQCRICRETGHHRKLFQVLT